MSLPVRLDARDDPRAADYRAVAVHDALLARNLFVVEGRRVVTRVIEDGRFGLRSVLLSEAAFEAMKPVLALLNPRIPVYVSSAQALSEVAGFNVHRGCLALADRPNETPVESLLRTARVIVIAEGVADPSNLGGIFRNGLAFGADAVFLSPTSCDPLYRKAVRTSMAATLRVPFARLDPWPEALSVVSAAGFRLVALTPRESAEDLEVFAASAGDNRLALMFGTEGEGLTPAAAERAHRRVRIPLNPSADSVNVAVAAGIVLYRLAVTR